MQLLQYNRNRLYDYVDCINSAACDTYYACRSQARIKEEGMASKWVLVTVPRAKWILLLNTKECSNRYSSMTLANFLSLVEWVKANVQRHKTGPPRLRYSNLDRRVPGPPGWGLTIYRPILYLVKTNY